MDRRLKLHELLKRVTGTSNVYFQPPKNLIMKYPAVRYRRYGYDTSRADDKLYSAMASYQVTYIDPDPDNEAHRRILEIPMCTMERAYTSDGLNHYVFNLFY